MGDAGGGMPDFFFYSFFPVQRTTSGIGHLVNKVVFQVGNQYAKCEKQQLSLNNNVDPMLLPSGNPFECHEEVLYLQPMIPPERFDIFPLTGGCSDGLDAFRFFLKKSNVVASSERCFVQASNMACERVWAYDNNKKQKQTCRRDKKNGNPHYGEKITSDFVSDLLFAAEIAQIVNEVCRVRLSTLAGCGFPHPLLYCRHSK